MDPLVYGDYPAVMRENVGSRLPSFSKEESKRLRGSFDFIGFNHYIVFYVQADLSTLNLKERDYYADAAVKLSRKLSTIFESQSIMLYHHLNLQSDGLILYAFAFFFLCSFERKLSEGIMLCCT